MLQTHPAVECGVRDDLSGSEQFSEYRPLWLLVGACAPTLKINAEKLDAFKSVTRSDFPKDCFRETHLTDAHAAAGSRHPMDQPLEMVIFR